MRQLELQRLHWVLTGRAKRRYRISKSVVRLWIDEKKKVELRQAPKDGDKHDASIDKWEQAFTANPDHSTNVPKQEDYQLLEDFMTYPEEVVRWPLTGTFLFRPKLVFQGPFVMVSRQYPRLSHVNPTLSHADPTLSQTLPHAYPTPIRREFEGFKAI